MHTPGVPRSSENPFPSQVLVHKPGGGDGGSGGSGGGGLGGGILGGDGLGGEMGGAFGGGGGNVAIVSRECDAWEYWRVSSEQ